jgi:hypothetical protein
MEGASAVKNNSRNLVSAVFCAVLFGAVLGSGVAAQSRAQNPPDGRNRLAHLQAFEGKMGAHFLEHLSTGGANMFHMAKVLSSQSLMHPADTPQARAAMARAMARLHSRVQAARQSEDRDADDHALVPVNDAGLDFQFSRFAGFTQSETSSAWCGDSIVAGFNDSGADVRSRLEPVGGVSFSGVAASGNRGRSFTGLPFLNPGPDRGTFLGGDPVVVCSDPRHFAYASLLSQAQFDSQGNLLQALTGIAISRSSTGGLTWDSPIAAVTKDANANFLDKEWLAIDPGNPNNLYVTYTDFQAHGTELNCPPGIIGVGSGPDVLLEMVASKDGGASWSSPVVIDSQCSLGIGQNLSGTQVAVGRKGVVYVAYASIDQKNAEMRFRSSTDGGVTFGPVVIVGKAITASTVGIDNLQGNFRTNAFPTMAVDAFAGAHRGALYLVWTDASRTQLPDLIGNVFTGDPVYSFGDVVLSVSDDGGTSWSAPRLVSPTPSTFKGAGRDQFMAGVALDASGALAVCYSDRRNDARNFAIDHFCSLSRDQGKTFKDVRETPSSWTPTRGTDVFINPAYMGDYDTVSSDATGANAGFFNTFQVQTNTNPDVFGMRLKF